MTRFILDSGLVSEYKDISTLAQKHHTELWGATTNPTLIAKNFAGKKISTKEAFALQKEIVMEILGIVPGAVSAEVYADAQTSAKDMIEQGRDIATWSNRIVVKLPTNREGFIARTELRKNSIPVNNTLVFSQEQIFAICLHEKIAEKSFGPLHNEWPSFISPFVGRLDDIGLNGMDLVTHGMKIKEIVGAKLWMLEASVRNMHHFAKGLDLSSELITVPAKVYHEWFALSATEKQAHTAESPTNLSRIPFWQPPNELIEIDSIQAFMETIDNKKLNIQHDLTDKGLVKFAEDWNAVITDPTSHAS